MNRVSKIAVVGVASALAAAGLAMHVPGAPPSSAAKPPIALAVGEPAAKEAAHVDVPITLVAAHPQSCDATLAKLEAGLRLPSAAIDEGAANALATAARGAVVSEANPEPPCARRAFELVARSTSCGNALTAIAAGLFAGDLFDADWSASLVEGATPKCLESYLPPLQHTTNVSMKLVRAVEKIAKDGASEELRAAGWLVLGSLELVAKRRREPEIASYVEGILKAKLASAAKEERQALLEAAGNGACEACTPEVALAAKDTDWRIRRASASAGRFLPSRGAVMGMCDRLRDEAAPVRELAAWSMQWRGEHDELRVDCLAGAATGDATLDVRRTAARALTVLAPSSKRAHGVVERLADDSNPEEVRSIAEQFLSGEGSDRAANISNVQM